MNTFRKLFDNIDDVVFAHRNKSYGAFVLRQESDQNMVKGMMLSLMFVSLVVIVATFGRSHDNGIEMIGPPIILQHDPIIYTPPVEPPKPTPPTQKGVAAPTSEPNTDVVSDQPTKVVNTDIPEESKPVEQVASSSGGNPEDTNTGSGTQIGNGNSEKGNTTGNNPISSGSPEPPKDNKPLLRAQVQPAFPGGVEALMEFLQKNIKYPDIAKEAYIEGAVVLQFVVMEDGSIDQVKIVRKLGYGCDEEAARVVKKMPNWSPGIHNDRKVKVRYTLPIHFKLQK